MSLNDDSSVYIGSTTQTVLKRFSNHKNKYNKGTLYCNSKLIFDKGNVIPIIIDTIYYEDRAQLLKIEGLYMEHYRNLGYNVVNGQASNGKYYGLTQNEKNMVQFRTKIQCNCGKQTDLIHKARHERSKYHQNYVNSLN